MTAWLLTILFVVLPTTPATSAPQENAGRAKQAYERAVALEAEGNFAAALSLLWEASGLAPRDADIQNRLGEALGRIGALDAAVDAFRNALAERPTFRNASNNLILALVKVGKGPEAVARARVLVAESPKDPDRYFTLGLAQSEQDVDAAIETFRTVLELAPRHTLARYNLALVLRRADRLTEALAELERALAIEPRPEAYYTMGVIYWHQGKRDRAVSALRAAVAADPKYADAHATLGSVLKEERDWTGASASLRRAIAIRPDLPASHYTLGQVLQLGGDDRGARLEFDQADQLRRRAALEHEALIWTSVGIQKAGAGDLTGALSSFRRATTAYEPYAPAHYQTGLVLQRLGQREASRAAFERARSLNPSLVPPPDIR